MPLMTLCTATSKEHSFTVISGTIVSYPFTAFAATSRSWRNYEMPSAMPAVALSEALEKITRAIRKRFGRRVRIIVRADSGFAREEIMAWCEDHAVYYCLGLARNKRLSARLGKGFGELYRAIESGEIQSALPPF